MYNSFRQLCERWLRIPPEPEPPPGDEASARVFRAAPKYLQYLRVLWGIRTGFVVFVAAGPLIAIGAILLNQGGSRSLTPLTLLVFFEMAVLLLLIGHSLFSLAMVNLNFEKRWYLVTDRSLRIREGVATVREITFTFANIQNLSVTQGPIQRLLGIADLKVETAGGGNSGGHQQQQPGQNLHTAYFRGIDNAEEVKLLIAQRMRGRRDSGLGDQDDTETPRPRPAGSRAVTDALGAVLAEAKALRQAAESTS